MNSTFVFKNRKSAEYTIVALFRQFFDVPVCIKFVYSTTPRSLMVIDASQPQPDYHFYDVVLSFDNPLTPDLGPDFDYSHIDGIDAESMAMHILKTFLKKAATHATESKLEVNY